MDRSLCFVAAVAFTCAGLPTSFGQIQLLSSGASATQLVTQTTGDGIPEVGGEQSSITNPFDVFATSPVQLMESEATSSANGSAVDRPVATTATPAPAVADPSSLAPGRSVLQTIHDQAIIAQLPNATYAPVQWSGAVQTPNPIAQILLRENCNAEALWAGYPAQRAAECAHMWAHIARHQTCTGCGVAHCGNGTCGQAGCGACGRTPVRNRYLAPATAGTGYATCASCDSTPTALPQVPTVAPSPAEFAPQQYGNPELPVAPATPYSPTSATVLEPGLLEGPVKNPVPGLIEGKVASLPTFNR